MFQKGIARRWLFNSLGEMCIRDSNNSLDAGNIIVLGNDECTQGFPRLLPEDADAGGVPVSYTHLDVYKRQL